MAHGRSGITQRHQWYHTSALMALIERVNTTGSGRLNLLKWHPDHQGKQGVEVRNDDPESKTYFKRAVMNAAGIKP